MKFEISEISVADFDTAIFITYKLPTPLRIAHHLCCNARCNRAVTRAVSAVSDVTHDVSLAAPRSGGP